jgi:GAF domain-containing protein
VATLVARGAAPEEVFATVSVEVARVLGVDHVNMNRYDVDSAVTVVGSWSGTGPAVPVGTRVCLGGWNVTTLVAETGQPARIDRYCVDASGSLADLGRQFGARSMVGVPISVEGRPWGVMAVSSTREESLPADSEARLAGFTELVATAIANAQARLELRGFADEQAAMRRVATLVARAAPPREVFAAVCAEVGRLLPVELTLLNRYEPNGAASTVVGAWARTGAAVPLPVGTRWSIGGRDVSTLIMQTGRAGRIDDYRDAVGEAADIARDGGIRSSIGVPISVEGRLWGHMSVASTREPPLPVDSEARLGGFTEMVATAIANAQARLELRAYASEQAALRHVATLVARASPPEEVFAAVSEEVGRLLVADLTAMGRYEPDGGVTGVGVWSPFGGDRRPGARTPLGGRNVTTLVFETEQPARIDDYANASGPVFDVGREWGVRSAVGAPISVEGRLWGVIVVSSMRDEPLPVDTEARLAGFTELVATAIANAEAQAQLSASRARIVATADNTRRRIERDLHDGTQQRLVSLALKLQAARAAAPPEADELRSQLDGVAAELTSTLDELREFARGIHPAILAEGGLRPALKALARRSAVPVELAVVVDRRLPEQIEVAAFFVVSEALRRQARARLRRPRRGRRRHGRRR